MITREQAIANVENFFKQREPLNVISRGIKHESTQGKRTYKYTIDVDGVDMTADELRLLEGIFTVQFVCDSNNQALHSHNYYIISW